MQSTRKRKLPSPTELQRLEESTGSASLELTMDDLREVAGAASTVNVQGARYPEHLNRLVGRRVRGKS